MTDVVVVEERSRARILRINRPSVYNALNAETLTALGDAVRAAVGTPGVRAVVITGTGEKAFSAGADLDELSGLDAERAGIVLGAGQRILAEIEHSPVPVIAAVNGLALGGGFELVLASTFAVLSTNASFALPESGLGLIPGYGGTQRLSRVVGPAVAAHMMLTGSRMSASRAYELGLTPLEPVEPADLIQAALDVADTVAARGPRAHAAILRALRVGAPSPQDLAFETALAAVATGSAEAREGVGAFQEKRSAEFPDPTEGW
ncbi:enoyl-CoA hydratase/isomerase family protein [Nocardioides marmoriginsengisoli]|uniref:enoyl-CoA hydratase n=1 Tax=Nocardioides marmoriginsengisoli TaxID=661483 RepID=A0A3N0CH90_9ACTN|nr:enoyl-CoA hydratase/isomerase family protein [Nocardioides marmoriginsengisoli]RNL62810.1 enoyl-CoA hydratase/isomerase family protein [Nocardioides marmoriginsengisoli]